MPAASAPAASAPATKSAAEHLDEIFATKGAQYLIGGNFYRLRTKGDRPAPFDPELRCDESNFEILGALMLFQAESGNDA
jgi:hypothetical protein